MYNVYIDDYFVITTTLVDNNTLVPGKVVTYSIYSSDTTITQPIKFGNLSESTVVSGVYSTEISIQSAGNYICYLESTSYLTIIQSIHVAAKTIAQEVWSSNEAVNLLSKLLYIYNIESGAWKIVNNQMLFLAEDNTTEIACFDLLDAQGNLTSDSVFERRRVQTFIPQIIDENGTYLLDSAGFPIEAS